MNSNSTKKDAAEIAELTIVFWITTPKEYLRLFNHFITTPRKMRFHNKYIYLRSLSALSLIIPNSSTNYSFLIPSMTSIQLIGNDA